MTRRAVPLFYRRNSRLLYLSVILFTGLQIAHCAYASLSLPVVYSTVVYDEKQTPLGLLSVLQGQEIADAVYEFSAQHHALSFPQRVQLTRSLCQRISISVAPCTRYEAVVFEQNILSDTGLQVGTLVIHENVEPIDRIYRFFVSKDLPITSMESVRNAVCSQLSCRRTKPLVYDKSISADISGSIIGPIQIPIDVEPADAVYEFSIKHNLTKIDRITLLREICNDAYVTCARERPLIFRNSIIDEDGHEIGKLCIIEDEELTDALFQFTKQYNLTAHYRESIFQNLCDHPKILCTRWPALLKSLLVNVGDDMAKLEILEGQEPADIVYEFADRYQISRSDRELLLDQLCPDPLDSNEFDYACSRYAPILNSIPVAGNNGTHLGTLEILVGDEPADAVARFGKKHNLTEEEKLALVKNVCEHLNSTCTRTQGLLHHIIYRPHGGDEEILPFFDGKEPADVIYDYATQRNLSFLDRRELLFHVCNDKRHRLNCTRAESMLLKIPVWESADQKLADFELLEGQEPVDILYAFLEKHDLFQSAPVNTSLHEVVCNFSHVTCAERKPHRLLFTMQATYRNVPHTIQYFQPESEWNCEHLLGGQKCRHNMEIVAIQYCITYMTEWTGCVARIVEALTTQLQHYEAQLWRGKDLYAKLGLLRTASREEIDAAYNKLVRRYESEPQKFEKLEEAYKVLSDPEEKYYYDLPCVKLFGCLCGKKKKDGSITFMPD